MRDIHRIMKFNVRASYNDARIVADRICFALMQYTGGESISKDTYMASVMLDNMRCDWHGIETKDISDTRVAYYRIKIFKIDGNRKSQISAISNKEFKNYVIANNIFDDANDLKG